MNAIGSAILQANLRAFGFVCFIRLQFEVKGFIVADVLVNALTTRLIVQLFM